jgi:hypothetical protein
VSQRGRPEVRKNVQNVKTAISWDVMLRIEPFSPDDGGRMFL